MEIGVRGMDRYVKPGKKSWVVMTVEEGGNRLTYIKREVEAGMPWERKIPPALGRSSAGEANFVGEEPLTWTHMHLLELPGASLPRR